MSTDNNKVAPTNPDEWYQPTLDGDEYFYWGLKDENPWSDEVVPMRVTPQSRQEWLDAMVRLVALAGTIADHDLSDYIGVAKRRNTPEDDLNAMNYAKAQHSVRALSRQFTRELYAAGGVQQDSMAVQMFHMDDHGVQLLIRSSMLSLMRNIFSLGRVNMTSETFGKAAQQRYDEGMDTSEAVMDAAMEYLATTTTPDPNMSEALRELISEYTTDEQDVDKLLADLFDKGDDE